MNSLYYVLDESHNPVAATLLQWAEFSGNLSNVRVAEDYVGSIRVSTIFIGTNIHFNEPPLVFETIVFRAQEDYQARYTTWSEAIAGHQKILEAVKFVYGQGNPT